MWEEIIAKFFYYFPFYVALSVVPAMIRIALERVFGIRMDELLSMSYEEAYRNFVLSSMFFPLFEEVVFRGLPMMLFGFPGLIIGSLTWVAMHPSWQLQYVSSLSLSKKILFTFTSSMYYACQAVLYGWMWINGDGIIAILYHMFHNAWITLVEILSDSLKGREIRIRLPRIGKEKEEEEFVARRSSVGSVGLFVARKSDKDINSSGETRFVRKKR